MAEIWSVKHFSSNCYHACCMASAMAVKFHLGTVVARETPLLLSFPVLLPLLANKR